MAGFWHLGDASTGRRRLAAAVTAVALLAVTAGVVAYGRGGDDDRSGLAMTAVGQGFGVEVPPDLPSREEILAAVQAASTAAGRPVPQATAPGVSSPEPATMADPPITPPALPAPPDLAGFPAADPEPATDQAFVTLANDYPAAVVVKVNGRSYDLAAGERWGPIEVTPESSGDDVIEVTVAEPPCGVGDAQAYFQGGGSYMLTLYRGPGDCNFRVTAA